MQSRNQADQLPGERERERERQCVSVYACLCACMCVCMCMCISVCVCMCMCDKRTEMGGYQSGGCKLKGDIAARGEKGRVQWETHEGWREGPRDPRAPFLPTFLLPSLPALLTCLPAIPSLLAPSQSPDPCELLPTPSGNPEMALGSESCLHPEGCLHPLAFMGSNCTSVLPGQSRPVLCSLGG